MTTVLSPIEFDHLVHVVRHRAVGYRAECWCDNGSCVPCLGLLVHCSTGEDLVTLADLLAAPVVADTEPDADGRFHQRATRTFGRVHIAAHASAAPTSPCPPDAA